MKFLMKTDYKIDIHIFDRPYKYYLSFIFVVWLILIPLIVGSFSFGPYLLYTLSLSGIYVVLILGLNLLVGYTGQISICHASLLAVGAYSAAILSMGLHLPFFLVMILSGCISALVGLIVGIPALRLKELYLAITTMGFSFIIDEVILQWESLTHGSYGYTVSRPEIGSFSFESNKSMYYLILVTALISIVITKNIFRSPLGRAFISIRDSEISAKTLGIDIARYKIIAFAISAFYAGVAGSLYAYFFTFIGPDNFTIGLSILFLIMVIIGGMGSIPGSIMGALFLTFLPEAIRIGKDYMPSYVRTLEGMDAIFYGGILILFIIYEPTGLYGRWLKVKYHAENFPLYRSQTFRRTKKFYRKDIK